MGLINKFIYCGILVLSLNANSAYLARSFQGEWKSEFSGCSDTPISDRIDHTNLLKRAMDYQKKLYIFGDVLVQEQTALTYCTLSQQALITAAVGNQIVLQFDYAQATRACREKFENEIGPLEGIDVYHVHFEESKFKTGKTKNYLVVKSKSDDCENSELETYYTRSDSTRIPIKSPLDRTRAAAAMTAQMGSPLQFIKMINTKFKNRTDLYNTEFRVTSDGKTPLMVAAEKGQVELVKLLLSLGASPLAKNESLDTAVTLAQKKGHFDIVRIIDPFIFTASR